MQGFKHIKINDHISTYEERQTISNLLSLISIQVSIRMYHNNKFRHYVLKFIMIVHDHELVQTVVQHMTEY